MPTAQSQPLNTLTPVTPVPLPNLKKYNTATSSLYSAQGFNKSTSNPESHSYTTGRKPDHFTPLVCGGFTVLTRIIFLLFRLEHIKGFPVKYRTLDSTTAVQ